MENRRRQTVDGFVARRRLNPGEARPVLNQKPPVPQQFLRATPPPREAPEPRSAELPRPTGPVISKSELSESLRQLDETPEPQKKATIF